MTTVEILLSKIYLLTPKQFDPSKLIINIECQEPSYIAGGLNYNVQNQQSVSPSRRYAVSQAVIPSAPFIPEPNIPQHINMIPQVDWFGPQPAQTTQGKFQNTLKYRSTVKTIPKINIALH